MIKESGGVVQTVALGAFVNTVKATANREARQALLASIAEESGFEVLDRFAVRALSDADRATYNEGLAPIAQAAETRIPDEVTAIAPPVDVSDFVDHIDYMVELIGLEHVGISSDFDGGGGIVGWNDASETFNVTSELARRGYTEEQIAQIWSGNLLRVLDDVQRIAAEIQAEGTN